MDDDHSIKRTIMASYDGYRVSYYRTQNSEEI